MAVKSYSILFQALADESRLRLLHLMRGGEICVCYLQGALQTNQPKISRHLAHLRRAGLVHSRRHGKWIYYSLRPQPQPVEHLLAAILSATDREPQIQRDQRRVKSIRCSPARFGLSLPPTEKRARSGCSTSA